MASRTNAGYDYGCGCNVIPERYHCYSLIHIGHVDRLTNFIECIRSAKEQDRTDRQDRQTD